MKQNFWHAVWERDSIGFHQDAVHPFLVKHSASLFNQSLGSLNNSVHCENILVPLCGKSLDIVWLAQYFNVIGTELSDIACRDFFKEHQLTPNVLPSPPHTLYQFENITLWQGDHFKLPMGQLPKLDWIYDRAALIALPKEMQIDYVKHLLTFIDAGASLLLVSLEFPQNQLEGPPFPVFKDDVNPLFSGYSIEELDQHELPDKQFARRRFDVDYLIERLYLIKKL
ncbi:thiopurine S-methyltransferase [Thalassotalea fusca]